MLVYKILRPCEWARLQAAGTTWGSAVDKADGFVHLSSAAQVPQTVARWFADARHLNLLALDSANLGAALRWEPSRGGALFPHLYAPLKLDAVAWQAPVHWNGRVHVFPRSMR